MGPKMTLITHSPFSAVLDLTWYPQKVRDFCIHTSRDIKVSWKPISLDSTGKIRGIVNFCENVSDCHCV